MTVPWRALGVFFASSETDGCRICIPYAACAFMHCTGIHPHICIRVHRAAGSEKNLRKRRQTVQTIQSGHHATLRGVRPPLRQSRDFYPPLLSACSFFPALRALSSRSAPCRLRLAGTKRNSTSGITRAMVRSRPRSLRWWVPPQSRCRSSVGAAACSCRRVLRPRALGAAHSLRGR